MSESDESRVDDGTKAGWFAWLAGILFLAGAALTGVWYLKHKPVADRKPAMEIVPVVEVMPISRTNTCITLDAMGVVMPAREVSLQAEVNARILSIHPQLIEGGVVRAGEVLMRLDASSYEAVLLRQKAALETAKANLRLEEGQQDVARMDLETMREVAGIEDVDRALALREPQLGIARAAVASAAAAVEEAQLNVARTTIVAPFDAVVVRADAEVGGRAAPGTVFAQLVGTDTFWVQAVVPVRRLSWIRLPDGKGGLGAEATVVLTDGRTRRGRVIRRLADIEDAARMARVMVEVCDPLGLSDARGEGAVAAPPQGGREKDVAPLLLQDYVRVRISGNMLQNVCRVPRLALHDGSVIWLLDDTSRLNAVAVEVAWGDEETVWVRGAIPEQARLITSGLAAPVMGMRLRLPDAKADATPQEDVKAGPHA